MIDAGLEVSARLFTWYDKEFVGAFAGASHLEGVEAAKDAGVDARAQVAVGVQAEKLSRTASLVWDSYAAGDAPPIQCATETANLDLLPCCTTFSNLGE